ncbi:hypothetical protein Hanom_Chr02g00131771 [Helianthus anomalus]
MIIMLQVHMSPSESGLSEEHDPMVVTSDDEIAHDPEPFALPDFGDDIPDPDDILIDDIFELPIPIHDHLIISHPDGEHLVAPILDVVPLLAIPPEDWPFDDLLDDDFDIFTGDYPATGLRLYATDEDDAISPTPSSPIRAPTPPHVPDHFHDPDPVPFGLLFIALLVPEPISAPLDLPPIAPVVTQFPPTDVVPPHFISDEHRTDLPISPSFNPFVSADFPPIPQPIPVAPLPLDEPFRWFPPYTMPISDPYHPSHYVGYTRDGVLELEFGEGARRYPFPFYPTSVPPPSSSSSFVPPPAAPTYIQGFNSRFLTNERQVSYLVRRVHELEEELAHIRNLIFFSPPPPPSTS